ncbi:hypothetical protein GOODEAATRI_022770, partial [Goodea atripinnis]
MSNLQNGFLLDDETDVKTLLFEGEQDHLTPSTLRLLLESDLFVVAGRIIGHSFLNGGPRLVGLSPGIIHVLFGGDPETATVTESDCADQDVREVITMVLERTKQVKQTQRGLKDTGVWELFSSRPDA